MYDRANDLIPEANISALLRRVQEVLGVEGRFVYDVYTGQHATFEFEGHDETMYIVRVVWPVFFGTRGLVLDYKMASEIATIKFLHKHTAIPVPAVLHHDRDADNDVGGEWMIMEYIRDSETIFQAWPRLTAEERRDLLASVADVWANIISLEFDTIGSLHADPNSPQGVSVGPMSSLAFRSPEASYPRNTGPFHSVREYMFAQITEDVRFEMPGPKPADTPQWKLAARRTVDELFPEVDSLFANRSGCKFVLNHIDFSPQNILVTRAHPTRVAAVIDWEGATVVPLFTVRPRWIWPEDVEEEKELIESYEALMRERVSARCPAWTEAMSEAFRQPRVLQLRACLILAKEKDQGIGRNREFLMPLAEPPARPQIVYPFLHHRLGRGE